MRALLTFILFFATLGLPPSVARADEISADSAWGWAAPDGSSVNIFFNLTNSSKEDDAVSSASFFDAAGNGLRTILTDKGQAVGSIPLRNGRTVRFTPRGYAIKIIGIPGQFKVEQQLTVILNLASGTQTRLSAIIRPEGITGRPRYMP